MNAGQNILSCAVIKLIFLSLLGNFEPNRIVQLFVVACDHRFLAKIHQQTLDVIIDVGAALSIVVIILVCNFICYTNNLTLI